MEKKVSFRIFYIVMSLTSIMSYFSLVVYVSTLLPEIWSIAFGFIHAFLIVFVGIIIAVGYFDLFE